MSFLAPREKRVPKKALPVSANLLHGKAYLVVSSPERVIFGGKRLD
jgi:hypothetical protein